MKIRLIKTGEIIEASCDYANELVEKRLAIYVGSSKGVIPHEQQVENEMRTIPENTMMRHSYVEK